ncbi:MAG: ribulose-phosphate 3-epimerase [Patescibacteria group bacterium]|nr:ribulose-phosphate 3-epimerase [Patescibacteria group bacterium]
MVSIIPSILVPTAAKLRARLQLATAHRVPWVQLDVADHTLVPAETYHDPDYLDQLHPLPAFEVHLMTTVTPESIRRWDRPWVKKIIFHLEATAEPRRVLQAIGNLGKLAGIALNPETPVEKVKPYLGLTDTLLVMGVNPGWGGQKILPDTVLRITRARRLHPHGNIEVDGGINTESIGAVAAAGANLLIVGSALTARNFATKFHQLTTLANAANQTP